MISLRSISITITSVITRSSSTSSSSSSQLPERSGGFSQRDRESQLYGPDGGKEVGSHDNGDPNTTNCYLGETEIKLRIRGAK